MDIDVRDAGTHTLAMIIDILLGRSPLYLFEKHYTEMDVELILGKGYNSSDILHAHTTARLVYGDYLTEKGLRYYLWLNK